MSFLFLHLSEQQHETTCSFIVASRSSLYGHPYVGLPSALHVRDTHRHFNVLRHEPVIYTLFLSLPTRAESGFLHILRPCRASFSSQIVASNCILTRSGDWPPFNVHRSAITSVRRRQCAKPKYERLAPCKLAILCDKLTRRFYPAAAVE